MLPRVTIARFPFLDIGWIFTDCKGRLYFQKHLSVHMGGGGGVFLQRRSAVKGFCLHGDLPLGVLPPRGGSASKGGLGKGRDLPNPRYWHLMTTTAAVGTHPNGSSLIFYQKTLLSSNFTKLPLTYALCRRKSNIRQDRQKCTIFSLTRLDDNPRNTVEFCFRIQWKLTNKLCWRQHYSDLIFTMDLFDWGWINSIFPLEQHHLSALFYYGHKSMSLRRISCLYVKGHAALSSW